MVITKTKQKRITRDERIVAMYKSLIDGGMKSAVYEQIARGLKTSITTVSRVVKRETTA